jgi:hypothetical protein
VAPFRTSPQITHSICTITIVILVTITRILVAIVINDNQPQMRLSKL